MIEHFGLYLVITNPVTSYEACAEAAVKAGLRYIQLRMKPAPSRDAVIAAGRNLAAIVKGSSTRFIVDDDPDVAVACGADGVHLGQGDLPISEARRRYPMLRIFGLSTHNPAQLAAASLVAPDYCGVGPVYKTPTKAIPDPTLGPMLAGEMIRSTALTTVAIGGVNAQTLPEVLKAGAINFAVVRDVCRSSSPYDTIRRLQDLWTSFLR